MVNVTLKELVSYGNKAKFQYYRNGFLYYDIEILDGIHEGEIYQLCLNPEDFKGTDLNRTEKSSIFMRWIREALKEGMISKVN